MFRIKFLTKRIFPIFKISKTNKMTLFCNLFLERPSYMCTPFQQTEVSDYKTKPKTKQCEYKNMFKLGMI